jgi:hypothetical protein
MLQLLRAFNRHRSVCYSQHLARQSSFRLFLPSMNLACCVYKASSSVLKHPDAILLSKTMAGYIAIFPDNQHTYLGRASVHPGHVIGTRLLCALCNAILPRLEPLYFFRLSVLACLRPVFVSTFLSGCRLAVRSRSPSTRRGGDPTF